MSVAVEFFGTTADNRKVDLIKLTNSAGSVCSLIQYGAAIQSLVIAYEGAKTDVALGFDALDRYEDPSNPSHGAIVGRHANRIENAEFELGGKIYSLFANEGRNNLHSSPKSFSRVVWDYEVLDNSGEPSVRFSYLSPDGESGFPGNLKCHVVYRLTSDNALSIEYDAVSDQETVINLTSHVYLNLSGGGDILEHELKLEADEYTPVNAELIPDGRIESVKGTPFDFRTFKTIGRDIAADDEQLKFGLGYDHNFILRGEIGKLRPCAVVLEPHSGRSMTVETTSPAVQLYTGNQIKPETGKNGATYHRFSGLCLETQFYPNSLKHKHFPSPIFKAGEHFSHKTVFKFA